MEKTKIILDCDTGIDDSLAIILALNSPSIEVLGINVVAGNTTLENAYLNTKRILHLLGRDDVNVYVGESKPWIKELVIADETHGEDGFGNISVDFDKEYSFDFEKHRNDFLKIVGQSREKRNIDFIKDLVQNNKDCVLVSIGPMTNIANLLKYEPDTFKNIKRVVSMGGSYKSHGNTSPVAEFNYWVDPDAAKYVYLNSPIKIEMVGLDVTRQIVMTEEKLSYIRDLNPSLGEFITKLTKFYFDFHWEYERIRGCVINDPLVIAYLIDEGVLEGFEAYTDISVSDITRGMSVVDDHKFYKEVSNSIIYTEVNMEKFFGVFYSAIRGAEKCIEEQI